MVSNFGERSGIHEQMRIMEFIMDQALGVGKDYFNFDEKVGKRLACQAIFYGGGEGS